ncbi:MAG: DNA helicase RecQ [Candidatus Magasanikbacteria bacterium]|nr:DNA helicase RecQ [Candidatus Magasanikbacteria bacterium]
MKQTPKTVLQHYFGYDSFRPAQKEIIDAVLQKQDVLTLMPTGGGKSLCFQIPALLMEGVCVVVSPLISLMKDQVDGLLANGVRAAYLNSSLTTEEQDVVESKAIKGEIDLLYVSPERLVSQNFLYFLDRVHVCLFAIDEAHCISSWGHDFRPEYTQLAQIKDQYPNIPCIALTATADRLTRKDIISQLALRNPRIFITSFDRPNISLTVMPGKNKMRTIEHFAKERSGQSGIVYCLSRKSTEKTAEKLQKAGLRAIAYHAGIESEERNKRQHAFIHGHIDIVCATIAFGMGIDKSNVRWVIHYNTPKNIEGYYQEIGRAGRDGLPSQAVLFYSFSDIILLREIVEQSGQKDVQKAKLDRMQQYADAFTCRRRILLHYFNETLAKNCNNCDVCKNPPKVFDGTIIVQKALSALFRLKEYVGTNTLIDVLRGSTRQDIIAKGYHTIKTYGAGKDISPPDWQQYILQMLHLGFIDIAYEKGRTLYITPQGKQLLLKKQSISLVHVSDIAQKIKEREVAKQRTTIVRQEAVPLFEALRKLRKDIATEEQKPAYIIFHDATLKELAEAQPTSEEEMMQVSGIGHKKFEQYGALFLGKILEFTENTSANNNQFVTA